MAHWAYNATDETASVVLDDEAEKIEVDKLGKLVRDIVLQAIPDALNAAEVEHSAIAEINVALACLSHAALVFAETDGTREVWLAFCREAAERANLKTFSDVQPRAEWIDGAGKLVG